VSPSAQVTSEQLKEIIVDEKKADKDSKKGQEHVQVGEEVLDPANSS